jgi:hypothetical protein
LKKADGAIRDEKKNPSGFIHIAAQKARVYLNNVLGIFDVLIRISANIKRGNKNPRSQYRLSRVPKVMKRVNFARG